MCKLCLACLQAGHFIPLMKLLPLFLCAVLLAGCASSPRNTNTNQETKMETSPLKRTLMQVYVKGSIEAVELYQKAFDAKLVDEHKFDDGTYAHAELDVYGQILAISEASDKKAGDNMQFCLNFHLGEKDKVTRAYDVLSKEAIKAIPPNSCSWSPYVCGVVDKFGIYWCIYVTE